MRASKAGVGTLLRSSSVRPSVTRNNTLPPWQYDMRKSNNTVNFIFYFLLHMCVRSVVILFWREVTSNQYFPWHIIWSSQVCRRVRVPCCSLIGQWNVTWHNTELSLVDISVVRDRQSDKCTGVMLQASMMRALDSWWDKNRMIRNPNEARALMKMSDLFCVFL